MKKYALLIGSDHYAFAPKFSRFAPSEALKRLARLLEQRRIGGFDRVDLLLNPGRRALIDAVETRCTTDHRNDLLLFCVAGLGMVDAVGRAHLLTTDASSLNDRADALSLAALSASMNLSNSPRQMLVLDWGSVASAVGDYGSSSGLSAADLGSSCRAVISATQQLCIDSAGDGTEDADAGFALVASLVRVLEQGDPVGTDRYLRLGRVFDLMLADLANRSPTDAADPLLNPAVEASAGSANNSGPAVTPSDVRTVFFGNGSLSGWHIARNRAFVPSSAEDSRRSKPRRPRRPTTGPADEPLQAIEHPGIAWYWKLAPVLTGVVALLALLADSDWSLRAVYVHVANQFQLAPHRLGAGERDDAVAGSFSDLLLEGGHGPEMRSLKSGFFVMGSPVSEPERFPSEGPERFIRVESFAVGRGEVTFDEYDRFAELTGRGLPDDEGWGRGDRPVINVSWYDALAYVQWLSVQTGQQYRLPSEVEWEYLARAGSQSPFATGSCIDTDQANYNGVYDYKRCGARTGVARRQTLPMRALPANRWGLYHVLGNVWEWVEDCWHPDYNAARDDALAWTSGDGGQCERRVIRGGGWRYEPGYLRSAARLWSDVGEGTQDIGFRVARDL